VLNRFEDLLDDYFTSHQAQEKGLPTVRYFADKVCLSPNYFGDLIKKETGRTPQEYIQNKIIDMAKEQLAGTTKTVNEISYMLGFQYSQHFSRYFKRGTGMTPAEYRKSL
jgi:AraC-like DNA-binding protein